MARKRLHSPPQSPCPTETRPRGRSPKKVSDDDGVTESQQILALGSLLKKGRCEDKETQQLRAKVAEDQRTLRALLQQRLRHAENERNRRSGDIANLISTALNIQPLKPNCPSYPGTTIAINPSFASAAEIITTSRGLIKEYDNIEIMVAKAAKENRPQIMTTWQQDVEETKRLLDLGHRKSLSDVKKVLGVNDGEEMAEMDEDGSGRLTKMKPDYGLRDTLRYAERGVKRMAKGLPRDIERD